jgi:hypothetical protein
LEAWSGSFAGRAAIRTDFARAACSRSLRRPALEK